MPRKAVERTNTSWRISVEAKRLLELMAEELGTSQSAVFEQAIREKARRMKITIPSVTADGRAAARERILALLEQAHRNDPGDLTPEELEHEVTLAHEDAREILRARRR
jgi:predicted transcriptional regulator